LMGWKQGTPVYLDGGATVNDLKSKVYGTTAPANVLISLRFHDTDSGFS